MVDQCVLTPPYAGPRNLRSTEKGALHLNANYANRREFNHRRIIDRGRAMLLGHSICYLVEPNFLRSHRVLRETRSSFLAQAMRGTALNGIDVLPSFRAQPRIHGRGPLTYE